MPVTGRAREGQVYRYSKPVRAESFSIDCCAVIRRTVPDRERITIESVTAPPGVYRTPLSSGPFVTPVAATKTSSPRTRSFV